ncbi:calcium-binding protein [Sphingobium yanoikuyae]|uniref:calcium-binding protein n=1 Tax=Sphingobium yanoikuyae TaxID=13690 RepID=UPI0022A69B4F|nr:calcium-binding protein [Sphingobium yanoikuyae]
MRFDFYYEARDINFTFDRGGANKIGQVTFDNFDKIYIHSGSGNDVLIGDDGIEEILGGEGNDILDGGSGGHDDLRGGGGNDILYGRGYDVLTGNGGDDIFYVYSDFVIVNETEDAGVDEVRSSMGRYYLTAWVENLVGTWAGGMLLVGNDLDNRIFGNVGNDTIRGGAFRGADALFGGAGDDVLEGEDGNDELSGGEGIDTVSYEHATAGVTVSLSATGWTNTVGAGTDWIYGCENILGSAFADVLTGDDGNNVLTGLAGADVLSGLGGDDVIEGGAGDDVLSGGAGIDTASYEHAAAGVQVSLATGVATGGAGNDTLSDFENVIGSAFADVLTGNDGNNVLAGLAGDDILSGGAGIDTASYEQAAAGVQVSLLTGLATGGAGNDTLSGIENIRGSAYADGLTGDDGNNALSGLAGDDLIEGGAGDDILSGGVGIDSVSYEHAVAGVQVSLAAGVATGGAGNDQLSEFENIRGSAYADMLTGDNGVNVLSGLAGADQMIGLGGDDEYWVDNQGDVIVEAVGGGYDRVFAKVDYTLADNVESLTLIGRGNIDAYGNDLDNILTGNSGNNRLRGFGGEDYMAGGAGNDIYHVNSWGDQVVEAPGGGTDLIVSSISIDLLALPDVENVTLVNRWNINLNGNALDNVLAGNSGDNVIRGFGGNDVLSGGAGRDSFGFDAAPGAGDLVQITDFSVADDIILLSHDQFGPIGSGSGGWGLLDPDAFVIGSVAADANDRILYDSATGALFYDADGNGAEAAVQFALLTPGLALTSADFNVIL